MIRGLKFLPIYKSNNLQQNNISEGLGDPNTRILINELNKYLLNYFIPFCYDFKLISTLKYKCIIVYGL